MPLTGEALTWEPEVEATTNWGAYHYGAIEEGGMNTGRLGRRYPVAASVLGLRGGSVG